MKRWIWPSSRLYYKNIFGAFLLAIFSSDVESLKQGIIKTSRNKVHPVYTILLVGETGVGKSAFVELLANVLIGNDVDHYSIKTFDRDNEQNDSEMQRQTNSARLYEIKSNNGMVVSAEARIVSMCNLFPRFASSTHLG